MEDSRLHDLLGYLAGLRHETECTEFKRNKAIPEDIGEYLSALSNSACLHQKAAAYMVWGMDSHTHEVVGTTFAPRQTRKGNEELENWLAVHLQPRIDFRIHEVVCEGKPVVILEVPAALHTPVRFKGSAYVRVGSYKKKLRDYPEKERALWLQLSKTPFEKGVAERNVSADQVLSIIDYPSYFELTSQALPADKSGILERLAAENIIVKGHGGRYDITNLGGILFARRMQDLVSLARKAAHVIIYEGRDRTQTLKEQVGEKGYATGFEGLIRYINGQLPQNEQIGQALRQEVRMYPEIAVREVVANAIIHQDFSATGDSPLVEVFRDRIEITNSGRPLIDTRRFIDEPPQSRNEALAGFMRRIGICEERGSGIDKVVFQVELFQLPAPEFIATENHTKVILYAHRKLSQMARRDKVRACYLHACLKHVSNEKMTNATLRKRLSISDKNYAMASRIIADTIKAELVKPYDPESSSRKHASYVPYWA